MGMAMGMDKKAPMGAFLATSKHACAGAGLGPATGTLGECASAHEVGSSVENTDSVTLTGGGC